MNNNIIVSALRARLEAEKAEGLAILSLYTNSSVGVGEHPGVIDEALTALKNIDAAISALNLLNSLTQEPNQQQGEK